MTAMVATTGANGRVGYKVPAHIPEIPVRTDHVRIETTWAFGRAKLSGAESLGVRIAVPPPLTYAERISVALSKMRDTVEQMTGNHFSGSNVRRATSSDEDGEESDTIVLQVKIDEVQTSTRADVAEVLLDFLADHDDPDVRSDISVEVY